MLTMAICEDESRFAADLKKNVERYLKERELEASLCLFSTGEELLRAPQNMDIILMDIRLPGRNGMEIAAQLRSRGCGSQLIFITAFREYVFRAFDLEAVHYMLKPVSGRKLYTVLDRAVKRAACEEGKALLVTGGDGTVRLLFRDILYCEVFDHCLYIHTMTENHRTYGTLDSLQRKLDGRFFRCHRSFLVNMDHVSNKEEGTAVMRGGGRVLISRRKQREFIEKLLQACRKEHFES